MAVICKEVSQLSDRLAIDKLEDRYRIDLPREMKIFLKENNGGIPEKYCFEVNGEEYEIRCFLSFNKEEYNSIYLPAESFQKETNGKIIPFAKDSADNYYCINTENLKIYFWSSEENLYYCLVKNFSEFVELLDDAIN